MMAVMLGRFLPACLHQMIIRFGLKSIIIPLYMMKVIVISIYHHQTLAPIFPVIVIVRVIRHIIMVPALMETAVIPPNIVPQDAVMAVVIQKHPVQTVLMHIIVQIVMAVHQAAVLVIVLVIIIIITAVAPEVFV